MKLKSSFISLIFCASFSFADMIGGTPPGGTVSGGGGGGGSSTSTVVAGYGLNQSINGSTLTLNLLPDTTSYIQNTSTLQSGSTFYVSSGTVSGAASVGRVTVNGPLTVNPGPVNITSSGQNDSVTIFGTMSVTNVNIPAGVSVAPSFTGLYISTISPSTVMAGVYGYVTNIGSYTPTTGHGIGVIGVGLDQGQSRHPLVGVEGRVNGLGSAPQYLGTMGLATHQDSAVVGATTTLVGLESRTETYAADGVTVESSGAVVGMIIRQPIGRGIANQTFGLIGMSSYPYVFGGSLLIAPVTSSVFGSPLTFPTVPTYNLEINTNGGIAGSKITSGNNANPLQSVWGRSNPDGTLGISAGVNNFVNGSIAGDLVFREETAGNKIAMGAGTGQASFYVNSTSVTVNGALDLAASAAPVLGSGMTWNDSTQNTLQTYEAGVTQSLAGTIWTMTVSSAVVNTTNEVVIASGTSGTGTLILPPNFFTVGKTLYMVFNGTYTTTGTPTLDIKVKLAGTTILDSGVVTLTTVTGTDVLTLNALITCRTTGAGGTVMATGQTVQNTSTIATAGMDLNSTLTTINTTLSQPLTVTITWGTASSSNNLTFTNGFVAVKN